MSDPILIYGATGYTGRLLTKQALASSLRPILAGRSEPKLAAFAASLGLEHRVVRLSEPELLAAGLRGVAVVLHAAGPFSLTSGPMVEACLRTGTHYLDISGEITVFEALVRRHNEARRRGIMVMPGVGFDVVASDCLAAHVARRLPGACRLAVGLRGLRFASRGSAKTLVEYAGRDIQVRRNGVLTSLPPGTLERAFDYGDGPRLSLGISWGDVASAYYTTGIPNIETYFEVNPTLRGMLAASRYLGWALQSAPWQGMLKACADMLAEGPTDEQRAASSMVVVAEVEDGRGRRARSRLHTPEAYTFTAAAGAAISRRVLDGDLDVGFQTPARLYGEGLVLGFAGVSREDLT